jgi:L-ascorbate metabolism protein UlaG (beta-lactamase superfamily)
MQKILVILFIVATILQNCSIVTIKKSIKRDALPKSIQISDDFKLSSTGAVYVNFVSIFKADFFPASFRIEFQDKIIYIDPLVVDNPIPADYIFITHEHDDHFSLPDIKEIYKKGTIIVGPESVAESISEYPVIRVKPGDQLDFGKIKCLAVPSYNLDKGFFELTIHPRTKLYVGYILSFNDISIYHPGDSDFIPEMKEIKNITIALLPIGTGNTAMNINTAAQAANITNPKIVVPMHYELGEKNPYKFQKLVKKKIKVEILQAKD